MPIQPRYQSGAAIGERYTVHAAVLRPFTEVYRCTDQQTGAAVTLEMPQSRRFADPRYAETFKSAAAIWLTLGNHPNLVRLLRVEQIEKQLFLIVESGEVETLRTLMDRGTLTLRDSLDIVIQVCRALKHAADSESGFVHRNLNPDDILLDLNGTARLGGFYLAQVTQPQSAGEEASESGIFEPSIIGTPAYMAPEQWLGETVDARADIYALGCLLFQMVAGKPLFAGNSHELRRQHLTAGFEPILNDNDLSEKMITLLMPCLSKSRSARYSNVEAFRKAINKFYESEFGKKPKRAASTAAITAQERVERGRSFSLLGRYDHALHEFNQALELDSGLKGVQIQRAAALIGRKQYRDALSAARAALAENSVDAQAHFYLGQAATGRGDLQTAQRALERAVQLGLTEAGDHLTRVAQMLENRRTDALQLSAAARVAHQLAAAETRRSRHEMMLPEHLLAGLAKLEDMTSQKAVKLLNLQSNVVPSFIAEAEELKALIERFGTSPRQTRRAMRILVGDGGYDHDNSEHISRSPEARLVFERAQQIAQEGKAPLVNVLHLLAALLDSDNDHITELFRSLNISITDLYVAASSLPVGGSKNETPYLDAWGIDLTEMAREGKLHDAFARDEEILAVLRTLGRESKNNPVLVGDAGVGKTAIVEGIAYRIATNRIDPSFHGKRLIQFNVADFVSGTKYRGEFEQRLQGIINEASEDPNVILFIDEIHMLVGAGLVEDSNMDAANILKPALARGAIRIIGATTESEYYRYIGKDAAFERRFQLVKVNEPTPAATRTILLAIRERFQQHHGVTIRDDAVDAAISLSVRYMPARRLPDKARDLLDEACVRARFASVQVQQQPIEDSAERSLIEPTAVTVDTIREVVAEKVGVPVARMTEDEAKRILQMPESLRQRVIGQERAVEAVTAAIRRNYADLRSGKRPVGVFLFVGPSGVGKTELARATANFLFGSDDRMIRLDMSEYMEPHSVARLVGAPPGYVGFEQGGQLTESLRRTPYAVVLLDEVEKAHPDVLNIFLQAFGEGRLTDGMGRTVDASNVIFMMTSNLGSDFKPASAPLGLRAEDRTKSALTTNVEAAIKAFFRPEMLNRLDEIIVFAPLSRERMVDIVRVHLKPLHESLAGRGIKLAVSDDAVAWLAENGHNEQFGARPLIRLIDKQITNEIGGLVLAGRLTAGDTVRVTPQADGLRVERL